MKRILALILAISLCFSLMLSLTACGKDKEKEEKQTSKDDDDEDETEETDETEDQGQEEFSDFEYVVRIITSDGTPIGNCPVEVYLDETLESFAAFSTTDETGTATIGMDEGVYYLVLAGAPEGYQAEPYYILDKQESEIVLQAQDLEYSVTVMCNNGETLAGETVEICKNDGSVAATGQTDDDGRFFTQLPGGKYFARLKNAPAGYYVPGKAEFSDEIAGIYLVPLADAAMGQTNSFTYNDQWLMPRGQMARFVPDQSGFYVISSDSTSELQGYIMNTQDKILTTMEQRPLNLEGEAPAMVCAMEAGKTYYISLYYWDPYETGTISYEIAPMPADYQPFQICSAVAFGYNENSEMIADNYVSAVLGSDGYYYEDLGGKQGSKIYANFAGATGMFNLAIAPTDGSKGMIEMGGFDFSTDGEGNPTGGEDCTAEIQAYAKQMITEGELAGFVPVDARLAELLQMLMDKYTFAGIEDSWLKLCCYYVSK